MTATPALVFSSRVAWSSLLASFADPIIWIVMAGFGMAAAFRAQGLDRRVSVTLALLYKGKDPRVAALFFVSLPAFLLTVTGSITASTAVVFPFVAAYLAMAGRKPGSPYAEGSMLALGQAASAGAMLLLISTAPNLVAKATVEQFAPGRTLTFGDWLVVGAPHAVLGLLVAWAITFLVIRPEPGQVMVDRARLVDEKRALGPMRVGEKVALLVLVLAIALWSLPSALRLAAEFAPALASASDGLARASPEAFPAILVLILLPLLRPAGKPLLEWEKLARGIDWNVVALIGGGIGLGLGMRESGFAAWIASAVAPEGAWASAWGVFAIAALLGYALSFAASNTAAAVIACPIAATLALAAGLDPVPPIIGAALACSISTAIPSTTPPMAIVYGSGYVKVWSMLKVGMVSDLARLGLLIGVGPFFASLVAR